MGEKKTAGAGLGFAWNANLLWYDMMHIVIYATLRVELMLASFLAFRVRDMDWIYLGMKDESKTRQSKKILHFVFQNLPKFKQSKMCSN